ncbi:MAG: cation transporter [Desulfurococcaceae archaeon]
MAINVVNKLKGAHKGFMYSALFSAMGLTLEILVFIVWGSIILFTDIVHWIVDTVLEFFGFVAIYYAIRVGRRFPWGVLVLEGAVMLLSITMAIGIYMVSFASYMVTEHKAGTVTTTNIFSAIGTVFGGVFTLLAFIVQKRNYEKYELEVLRVDYTHALIDLIASAVSTIGIVTVYLTRNSNIELLFVFISMTFIVHSLIEIMRDVIKTITGTNIDHELSIKLYKKIMEKYTDLSVDDVIARKIGSFYTVEVKIGVNPETKISTVHKLRKRIIKSILEESRLIYHVEVKIYPVSNKKRR